MIAREAANLARTLATEFKIVAIIGPRQAGKTTMARAIFSDKPYVNLENPDDRRFALEDPRRFLDQFPIGAVIDEAQRCPDLFSYLQGIVDAGSETGQFILTGSQHFGLLEKITQSLAGRVGFVQLMPFSLSELSSGGLQPDSLEELLLKGGYPPIYDTPATPEHWYNAYLTTYVERDVRQVTNVRDLSIFNLFVRLCAGNIGQLLNLSRIGADTGVDQKTARAWLGILETAFIIFRLRPHHRNFRKRLVKSPKLYFLDSGLAARLLGIEVAEQLVNHSMRGALFENWVLTEILKGRWNRGKQQNLYFWRSHVGQEIDILLDKSEHLMPIEVKSGKTVASDWVRNLQRWCELAGPAVETPTIVYGGDHRQNRGGVDIVPWREIGGVGHPKSSRSPLAAPWA